ncbi:hypothetical protein Pcaca03_31210 [Pectobacterium carotovorum subsp. carotovorum]|uniref:Uncharacterized protein n=1 Tax=Pectobacterium carotovorum subsp. carotovorum TaxID=555 RepID=A0AAI9L3T2_PECCC|nr:hypothetical protein SOASR014_15730 [Pectobacterium carotovorum subsp. carotovorum]GKX48233.1 hypothetical protein SOASR016_29850 [Pectobacterium carotovorum subsp. carotovorum]GLV70677.1 hypothetical protein Pcaca03_31210 [Pectobacterium carotovorum subsp. carotovorum]GLX44638.1 hypothetical protein Pcaca01_23060 [Pectobacterium carotovorum subsp. carotovorum]
MFPADNLFVTYITKNDESRKGMAQKQKGRQSIDSFMKKGAYGRLYPRGYYAYVYNTVTG